MDATPGSSAKASLGGYASSLDCDSCGRGPLRWGELEDCKKCGRGSCTGCSGSWVERSGRRFCSEGCAAAYAPRQGARPPGPAAPSSLLARAACCRP